MDSLGLLTRGDSIAQFFGFMGVVLLLIIAIGAFAVVWLTSRYRSRLKSKIRHAYNLEKRLTLLETQYEQLEESYRVAKQRLDSLGDIESRYELKLSQLKKTQSSQALLELLYGVTHTYLTKEIKSSKELKSMLDEKTIELEVAKRNLHNIRATNNRLQSKIKQLRG